MVNEVVDGAGPTHGKDASEGGRVSGEEGRLCSWGGRAAWLLLRA